MTSDRVSNELLVEMLAGLEGVTSGPWQVVETLHPWSLPDREFSGAKLVASTGHHTERRIFTTWDHPQLKAPDSIVTGSIGIGVETGKPVQMVNISEKDAAHIARCDPNTMRSILTELQSLRSPVTVSDRMALAKAFHDGPLGADDHEFQADSEQGKWCLSVVDFFYASHATAPFERGDILEIAYAAAEKALSGTSGDIGRGELERVVIAILAAITDQLSEPSEPVAWRVKHGGGFTIWNSEINARNNAEATNGTVEPLYASPAALVPAEQEGEILRDIVNEAHKNTMARPEGRRGPFIIPESPTPVGDSRVVAGIHKELADAIAWRKLPGEECHHATLGILERTLSSLEAVERERDALANVIDPNDNRPALMARIIMSSVERLVRAETAEASLAAAREALKPFDVAARALFTRNYNRSDVVVSLPVDASHPNQLKLTAGDFFAVRAALTKEGQ